jgi:hypothetical protein
MAFISKLATIDWGTTGASLFYRVLDGSDVPTVARTTTGIQEIPAGSGLYRVVIPNFDTTKAQRIIWDDGTTYVEEAFNSAQYIEDLYDIFTSSQIPVTVPVAPSGYKVVKITQLAGGVAVANCEILITSDVAGTSLIARLITDSSGIAYCFLPLGTYYKWAQHNQYTFQNPKIFVVD